MGPPTKVCMIRRGTGNPIRSQDKKFDAQLIRVLNRGLSVCGKFVTVAFWLQQKKREISEKYFVLPLDINQQYTYLL
jgi:hypothetical protein